ncbi:hypothetical protein [Marinibactrum halimedae]|uniref:Uncharacterized protein n=1 Tax=Marinibactrum halimedae TaxID=1444977 RepID=A0AA37TA71_9GAMM|nr:hypothetical protein [Marinibactrum halimedae]MCD9458046.1 hypothetical protein [Marinibactrum halimedae]GLS27673.1 hypothetical protein GCM10007877_33920 [Marinibactrum halimedae]
MNSTATEKNPERPDTDTVETKSNTASHEAAYPPPQQTGQSEPPPWAATATMEPAPPWWKNPTAVGGMVALVALMLVVIFLLPSWVSSPGQTTNTPEPASTPKTSAEAAASVAAKGPAESPWSEAQLAKQRREAQDILAKLLDKQRLLEKRQVNQWNQEGFEGAMASAAIGDEHYRQRAFETAKASYRTALSQFDALLAQSDVVLEENLNLGLEALNVHDAEQALKHLSLALAVNPAHNETKAAMVKAQALQEILPLITQSKQLQEQRELDLAMEQLVSAEKLDPTSDLVRDAKSALKQRITDRDFAKAMSSGYSALDQQQLSTAGKHFQRALKLKPQATDAKAALKQTQNQSTQNAINAQLQQARAFEDNEQWQEALTAYRAALNIDGNIVTAKVGEISAKARLTLDKQLQGYIDEPLRLSAPNVHQQASKTLNEAKAIPNKGERISTQITGLTIALIKAQTPITVQLRSDNITNVTLYRVGKLGIFSEHTMELKPGAYTLVGTRKGYRDVRKDITINAGGSPPIITIQCEERIASAG